MPHEAEHREVDQLLDAVMAIGSGLQLDDLLGRIVTAARELSGARYAALGVLDRSGRQLSNFVPVGIDDETRSAIGDLPKGHGILGLLIVDARPLRLPDLRAHPDSYGFPPGHPPMSSFLGVPVRVRDQIFGNLYLTEKVGAASFTDLDERLVVALAGAAGVAIENARLHARLADVALTEDRERIARDLHDTVIQRLFAMGLALQGIGRSLETDPQRARERIDKTIDDLDLTVRHIRTVIFDLESGRGPGTLRDQLLALCRESAGALGFEPRILFDGPLDSLVPDRLAVDLLATLREALSNAARHAGARRVDIEVAVRNGWLELDVADDGVGIDGDEVAGHGLANMRARCERLGGRYRVGRSPEGGTRLGWAVPLPT